MTHSFDSIVAIDFETANSSRSSACAVAAVKMDLNGCLINEYYSLINPHEDFDLFNILIHGITPESVSDAPSVGDAMKCVFELIDPSSLVVCHNAAFDISVMRNSLQKDPVDIPDFYYTCTYRLSKRLVSSLVSYTLPDVSDALGIAGLVHHNAKSDATICGLILLGLASQFNNDFDAMLESANLHYGQVNNGIFEGIHKINSESTGRLNKASISEFVIGEESPFYQKNVCFTGKLESMTRDEAFEIITQIGGFPLESLKKNTDYLITGYQNPALLAGKPKSNKIIKAEEMMKKGKRIEVIPEDDFLKMLF